MKSFNRILSFLAVTILFAVVLPQSALSEVEWKIVSSGSRIKFNVKHFVLMEVDGKFKNPKGKVITKSEDDFTGAKVEAVIPIKTVYTGNVDRDEHLKQEEFFHESKYPEMIFKSTNVTKVDENNYDMVGSLTIRGVTKPIKLAVVKKDTKTTSSGKLKSRFTARGSLDRYEYGLKWNELTEAGGMVVAKNIDIVLDVCIEKER